MCREIIDDEDELDANSVTDVVKITNYPHLVNLVDHSGFENEFWTRKETAWEICNAGTLNALMLEHGEGLPESLIWHTILDLLMAVRYLNTGRRTRWDDRKSAIPGWKPVVHNAINPSNIFYMHPRQPVPGGTKATYGLCKLGNFSRAMIINDPQDTVDYLTLQNNLLLDELTGYEAPELCG